MNFMLDNWELIGVLLASIFTYFGLWKYLSKKKFNALWDLIEEAIIILANEGGKVNVDNVNYVVDSIKNRNESHLKAFNYLDNSPEDNKKIIHKVIEARKFIGVIGEVGNLTKLGYNLFKGFKKLF